MNAIHPGQWRLDRIELLNWGTFQGHWTVPVARRGFLVTGPSGSGKSSLLDAVSAVLTPRGKLRFNAAANDGGARGEDRSLVSYVRGAWRRSADEETGEVASEYLRPNATHSGILLRYDDGNGGKPVVLVKLYHLRRGSNTPSDVQELSLILQDDAALPDFVPHLGSGIDVRKIKAAWPDAVAVTDKHSSFAARFSRLLGISGENAVLLLHKTQAAKSLGNLDELFRTFMLDEPRTFAMAENAVAQFGELSQAHAAVVQARRQRDHLQDMAVPARAYEASASAAAEAGELHGAVPAFKDAWKLRLAEEAREAAGEQLLAAEHAAGQAADHVRDLYEALSVARQRVSENGGAALETQRAWIALAEREVADATARRARLATRLGDARVPMPESFADLEELRGTAARERTEWEAAEPESKTRLLELHDARSAARHDLGSLEKDITALRTRRSNLDRRLLDARTAVAEQAGLPEKALPFAGELLEVEADFADWTGAIERVLRPLATVMLVPQSHLAAVRKAVDALHLGTRLVFEDVPARPDAPRKTDPTTSLVHRVLVADCPMSGWLHLELSRRYDYACVESPADLAAHEQAVTRAGQVRRSRTKYEKDDRHRVDDRRNWYLGFGTESKLEHLIGSLAEARKRLDDAERSVDAFSAGREATQRRLAALEELDGLQWQEVDTDAAEASLAEQRGRLESLLAASDDLRAAQDAEREADARHEASRRMERERQREAAEAAALVNGLEATIAGLRARNTAGPVDDGVRTRLERLFAGSAQRRRITHDIIDDVALAVSGKLSHEERTHADAAQRAARDFGAAAHDFRAAWPAAAADLGSDIEDRAGYLGLLDRLVADGLPQFESRFFGLLESQSQQNVAQLAAEIRRAPGEVRDRVDPVNRSLGRSAFDEGRFLRIQVKENRGELGRQFLADLQDIATGSWTAEDREEAERRFETMRRLMGRLASSEAADASWRRHCLDTRLHVRFTALEIDAGGVVVNIHDSSAGLSGGQQQKLVTFCLAAALRYQLTRDDELLPRYGTVMMDEAFDKADARFTRMAMDVFHEFGFHMVLATPLKLLQTLSEYIGGTAVIKCVDFRDSRIATLEYDAGAEPVGDAAEGPAAGGDAEPERGRDGAPVRDEASTLW
ncbi:ATP-binding protein [Arthrobacter sp. KK5.5]|uniref:ATP-binding protein n=1 Tax=Arthrobacter sp. KK5.5 TaxID=3373084 RepID=UPI003EE60FC2